MTTGRINQVSIFQNSPEQSCKQALIFQQSFARTNHAFRKRKNAEFYIRKSTQPHQQTTCYCHPATKPSALIRPTMINCNSTINHLTMRSQEFVKRTNTISHWLPTPKGIVARMQSPLCWLRLALTHPKEENATKRETTTNFQLQNKSRA